MRRAAIALVCAACAAPDGDLPRYVLSVDPGGRDMLEADPRSDRRVPATLVVDGEALRVTVRYRGDTARITTKHSWSVNLGPGETMLDPATGALVDELNLLSNYFDASQLRAVLSFELLAWAGVPGPRAGLGLLEVDGCPAGVYTSVEEIDHRLVARLFGRTGDLYVQKRGCSGRLRTDSLDCYRRVGGDAREPFASMVAEMESTTDFAAWLEANFDAEGVVGWIAVNTAIANDDVYHKNHSLARVDGRWRVLPWDYDLSFGRYYLTGCRYTCDPVDPAMPVDDHGNTLVRRVLATPALRARVQTRVRELFDGPLAPEAFDARLGELWRRVGPAVRWDPERRSIDPDGAVQTLRQFVRARREFLAREFP